MYFMRVCTSWIKDGRRYFGREVPMDRCIELCRKMQHRTGAKHHPCHISPAIEQFIDKSPLPDQLSETWRLYTKYQDVVEEVVKRLRRTLKSVEAEEFQPTVEAELYRLIPCIDESKPSDEIRAMLYATVLAVCRSLFQPNRSDIMVRCKRGELTENMEYEHTPDSMLCEELEQASQHQAIRSARLNMTKMERKIFFSVLRGNEEQSVASKLHVSKQRVNKLKFKAVEKVREMYDN